MSRDLEVEYDDLLTGERALVAFADRVQVLGAQGVRSLAEVAGAVGHPDLAREAGTAGDALAAAHERIAAGLVGFGRDLGLAAGTYAEVDGALAQGADRAEGA